MSERILIYGRIVGAIHEATLNPPADVGKEVYEGYLRGLNEALHRVMMEFSEEWGIVNGKGVSYKKWIESGRTI